MITLERLKEVLSYDPESGEFTGRICTVVARARGGATTPDMAGEASRNVPDRRIHFHHPVRLNVTRAGLAPGNAVFAVRQCPACSNPGRISTRKLQIDPGELD
jgi:hypothetical protein